MTESSQDKKRPTEFKPRPETVLRSEINKQFPEYAEANKIINGVLEFMRTANLDESDQHALGTVRELISAYQKGEALEAKKIKVKGMIDSLNKKQQALSETDQQMKRMAQAAVDMADQGDGSDIQ